MHALRSGLYASIGRDSLNNSKSIHIHAVSVGNYSKTILQNPSSRLQKQGYS
ncbi:hypothetical protein B4088_4272 [Bacillus cereus]|uniref:Uncharacterized protein n=1 Tax=Bacillus cereus TaxID=1396 RepID=A0A161T219_BACCE|nr:hypothetical protein B4088_4272 [Bacillus cereus]